MNETHHTTIAIEGKRFTLIFQNDGQTFQTVVYRADAIELFDVETAIVATGAYAPKSDTIAHIRQTCAYLWNN